MARARSGTRPTAAPSPSHRCGTGPAEDRANRRRTCHSHSSTSFCATGPAGGSIQRRRTCLASSSKSLWDRSRRRQYSAQGTYLASSSKSLWDRSRRRQYSAQADLSLPGIPIAHHQLTVSRLPRLKGFGYRGRYAYFLTFCTFERKAAFRDASVASMVVEQILRAAKRFEFDVFAYCVMPDHAHLLVHGRRERSDLHRFVKRVKQSSGQIYAHSTKERLWQDSYYDHVVRPEENLAGIARYIIENPVRARLVSSPIQYPFSGSDSWSIEELLKDSR